MIIIDSNKVLKLTLDLPKSVNSIYGRDKFGSTYLKKVGKDYKKKMIELIKKEVNKQDWIKLDNIFIYLDEIVFMNRKGRDADNLKKLTQDCITESGCVWVDDTICWARTNRVFIDNINPRLEITLSQSPSIGIFDDKADYDRFIKEFCSRCKKGDKIGLKGGCSIYSDMMDNRIREEIPFDTEEDRKNKKCLKFKENKLK